MSIVSALRALRPLRSPCARRSVSAAACGDAAASPARRVRAAVRPVAEALERRALLTVTLADPSFESPAVPGEFPFNPAGRAWAFAGSAGITALMPWS